MPRCPACDKWLRGEPERIGARCPSCRMPLYERPEHLKPRPPSAPDSACTLHPGNPAVGTCARCGNFQCDLCRTRWRGRPVCIACVNRALESDEARPEEVRAQLWQALAALALGILGWVAIVLAFVIIIAGMEGAGGINIVLVGLGGLLIIGSPVISVVGVGLGAAALRARGSHMILATVGLILSGLHVGAVIGIFTFSFWRNA
jgi:hypothetical protein